MNGGALRQALISQRYRDGLVPWGGSKVPRKWLSWRTTRRSPYFKVNSMLLDLTGILFACQLFVLMMLGEQVLRTKLTRRPVCGLWQLATLDHDL